ncbi:hypothetical protein DVH05_004915 [Phytophthora capsici]|nr:hypothetical protein DVH05_004915 [Phytophthora capsici]
MEQFFSLTLTKLPEWLSEWGERADGVHWEVMDAVAADLWTLGCVVTMTAIWRWNVNRKYPEAGMAMTITDYPLTSDSSPKLAIVTKIINRMRDTGGKDTWVHEGVSRVDFFDGGSRGNPGPGGSGSVIVEVTQHDEQNRVVWAAATSLAKKTTTNNLAEFIGLHRLLQRATELGWRGLHIVGDSALILRLMRNRQCPKSRNLQYWYREARRLADKCDVSSWNHHYRCHNKMADWLANVAMDNKRSKVWVPHMAQGVDHLMEGFQNFMTGDMQRWMNMQQRVSEEEEGRVTGEKVTTRRA